VISPVKEEILRDKFSEYIYLKYSKLSLTESVVNIYKR